MRGGGDTECTAYENRMFACMFKCIIACAVEAAQERCGGYWEKFVEILSKGEDHDLFVIGPAPKFLYSV